MMMAARMSDGHVAIRVAGWRPGLQVRTGAAADAGPKVVCPFSASSVPQMVARACWRERRAHVPVCVAAATQSVTNASASVGKNAV